LNAYINDEKTSGLESGFRIGHSYFCSKPNCDEEKWYENIIKYEIAPMLMEYWFDEKDKADEWIGKIK
jgi:5-methylcytosine-specific restriction protein B